MESVRRLSTAIRARRTRTRTLAGFKQGDVRVLVATDIAARGLDIEHLPHVVNFELPECIRRLRAPYRPHGSCRTRRNRHISSVSMTADQRNRTCTQTQIPQEIIEGYEPDPSIKAEPILTGRNNSNQFQPRNFQPGRLGNNVNSPNRAPSRKLAKAKSASKKALIGALEHQDPSAIRIGEITFIKVERVKRGVE